MTGERRAPEALIIAGPNGAGKTTASRVVVPTDIGFINADRIAAELVAGGHAQAGLDIAAGRVVLASIRERVRGGESFAVETNLAGRSYVGLIDEWRHAGFTVRLAFIALRSPELALRRVAARVEAGGHDVPAEVVRRRWQSGLRSFFEVYLDLVDGWTLTDNSDKSAVLVADGGRGRATAVHDRERFAALRRLSRL